jgi:hypothetical protein
MKAKKAKCPKSPKSSQPPKSATLRRVLREVMDTLAVSDYDAARDVLSADAQKK